MQLHHARSFPARHCSTASRLTASRPTASPHPTTDAFRWLKAEAMEYQKHNNTGMAADKTEKKSGSENSSKETAKGSGGAKEEAEGESKKTEKSSGGAEEEAEMKTAAAGAAGQI